MTHKTLCSFAERVVDISNEQTGCSHPSWKGTLSMEHAGNALEECPRHRSLSPEGQEGSGAIPPPNHSSGDDAPLCREPAIRPSEHTSASDHALSGSNTASTSPMETSPRTTTPLIDAQSNHPEWKKGSPSPGSKPSPNSKGPSSGRSPPSTTTCPQPKHKKIIRQGSAGSSGSSDGEAHRSGSAKQRHSARWKRREEARGWKSTSSVRPTPEQIALNQQLVRLERADAVLALVDEARLNARRGAMALNGTNLATALHRTASKVLWCFGALVLCIYTHIAFGALVLCIYTFSRLTWKLISTERYEMICV